MVEDAWTRVKRRLRAELGEDVFSSWLARLEMDDLTESAARLSVPTRFLKSWIEAHYLDRVLTAYRSEQPAVASVSIVVRGALRETNGHGSKFAGALRRNVEAASQPAAVSALAVAHPPQEPAARA